MKNYNAIKVNEKLGVNILDENFADHLRVNKFTKKQIKELCIDDLIQDGKGTVRLSKLIKEIIFGG